MKKKIIVLSLLMMGLSLSAHAETANPDAITTAYKHTYLLTVPSGGTIENVVMLGSIKAGTGTNTITKLVDLLKSTKPMIIAVVGLSEAISTATIEAALKEMKGAPSVSSINFRCAKKFCDELDLQAKTAGIEINTQSE